MKTASIGTWQDVGLQELVFAYRKAKADCFFDRSIYVAREFAEYEAHLPANLSKLVVRLQRGKIANLLAKNLGTPRLMAKKLGLQPKENHPSVPNGHGFFSDPQRAFQRLCDTDDLTPEFRLIGDFPVTMHILSALWVNLVGHKFDAALSQSAYGSRLRRYRREPTAPSGTVGNYHIEAIGSFQPYFAPYKTWRERGLKAIRDELKADRAVIAVSMDLTSYYHRVDPSFIANKNYLADAGIQLTDWEYSFTSAFATALNAWSDMAATMMTELGCSTQRPQPNLGGLPIGLSAARVAANALLMGLDRDIEQGLAPVYYGRYVDDLFLVMRDPGHLKNSTDLLRFIAARTKYFPVKAEDKDQIRLKVPRSFKGDTSLVLQQTKQKAFFLYGQGGLDLLTNIESQIRSVSSERRLMPSPDRLEVMASAKVLTAAAQAAEEADTLRRADGLAVRRMGWSIQLRAVETLARDLRQEDWRDERTRFYEFAHNHILRPDRILDHIDYLPRLLQLAVALMDWPQARRLVDGVLAAVDMLQVHTRSGHIKVNGVPAQMPAPRPSIVWDMLRECVLRAAADAISRSLRWNQVHGGMRPLPEIALSLCELVGLGSNADEIERLALQIRESDWAKTPYKDHVRRDAKQQRSAIENEQSLFVTYPFQEDLREFLEYSSGDAAGSSGARINPRCTKQIEGQPIPSLLPYLFPTRPYSTQEVSLFLPDRCIFGQQAAKDWARYVRAIRGVWVRRDLVRASTGVANAREGAPLPSNRELGIIGGTRSDEKIRLGISSLYTSEDSFRAAVTDRKDISRERYQRIERLVNQTITAHPRPTHLLLPELSLPERWIDTVSGLLGEAGISLIAGLDYHLTGPTYINSEAVLVLIDDRLGFPSTVQIRQPKALPAPGEEELLIRNFGKTWLPSLASLKKPVYAHKGFCFGVLVCSELQNMSHRLEFQGKVDCVMILSWNQDLETFSALVESASLDVHAHIALVNNRKYGDSRVRSPAKAHHARDICRLRGGQNEHLVVVELDIEGLRAFQSRDRRWPSADDLYKPVPEGFKIAAFRKAVPH